MKLLVGNPHGDGIVKVFDTDTGEVTVLSDGNIGGTHGELTTAVETLKERPAPMIRNSSKRPSEPQLCSKAIRSFRRY